MGIYKECSDKIACKVEPHRFDVTDPDGCVFMVTHNLEKKLESLFLLTWHWNKLTVWGLCLHVILPRWPFIIRFVRLCVCWGFLPAFFRVLVSFVVELKGDFGIQADAEVVVHHTLLWALSVIMKHADGLLIPDFVWVCVCVLMCVLTQSPRWRWQCWGSLASPGRWERWDSNFLDLDRTAVIGEASLDWNWWLFLRSEEPPKL